MWSQGASDWEEVVLSFLWNLYRRTYQAQEWHVAVSCLNHQPVSDMTSLWIKWALAHLLRAPMEKFCPCYLAEIVQALKMSCPRAMTQLWDSQQSQVWASHSARKMRDPSHAVGTAVKKSHDEWLRPSDSHFAGFQKVTQFSIGSCHAAVHYVVNFCLVHNYDSNGQVTGMCECQLYFPAPLILYYSLRYL